KFRQVRKVAIEPVRPNMGAAFRVDHLCIDQDRGTESLNTTFKDVAYTKFPPDLLHVYRLAFIGEGGGAGDDEAARDARKIGGQVVGDGISKVVVVRVWADIGKGQHDD